MSFLVHVNPLINLNAQIKIDFAKIGCPAESFLPPLDKQVLDVAIIGGGMAGSCAALALAKVGITNLKIFEAMPAGQEGPWASYARMKTLRSPKTFMGPALDIPNLTFRTWYTVQHGQKAWEKLGNVPTKMWGEYLLWFRDVLSKTLGFSVAQGTRVTSIKAENKCLRVTYEAAGKTGSILCRKVVLATGRDGFGGAQCPHYLQSIPKELWAHTRDDINFSALKGKKVAVLGAGPSAFDAAATALEAGSAKVDMLMRRQTFITMNTLLPFLEPKVIYGYRKLSDEEQFQIYLYKMETGNPPPVDSLERVKGFANFAVIFGCNVKAATAAQGHISLQTSLEERRYDFVIAATGFAVNIGKMPVLASFAHNVQLWGDRPIRFQSDPITEMMKRFPYLSDSFALNPKKPNETPGLENIHCFNSASYLNHPFVSGDIPDISKGATRLAHGIAAELFMLQKEEYLKRMRNFSVKVIEPKKYPFLKVLRSRL